MQAIRRPRRQFQLTILIVLTGAYRLYAPTVRELALRLFPALASLTAEYKTVHGRRPRQWRRW